MKNRLFAMAFLTVFFLSPCAWCAPRPNILYFYVDDMGWGAIGPNGQTARKAAGKPYVQTPTLDKLAAAGVNFSRFYGATVCSPARSSQQTGFHQGHTFADRNDPNNAKKAMRADDILMGDALAAEGYVTGYWGKWGYGGSASKQNPVIDNIQTLPTSHGYKYVLAELHHVRAHTFFQPTLWSAPARAAATGGVELIPNSMKPFINDPLYPESPSNHNHPQYPATAYCDDSYAFAALEFVRAQARHYNKTGQPFFGLLAVQIPHAPFAEISRLPGWDSAYARDPHFAKLAAQSKQWAAMVTRIDAHFGNILAVLEDPNGDGNNSDSVADNTLVIFQSDNGGPGGSSCKEYDANGGLRGNKGSIYEGGIRVPTIMRWPAKITGRSRLRAGTTSDMVFDVSDLLPTFCELAGATPTVGLDGVSLAPTILGSGHQRTREFLIHEAGNYGSIIRGRYKLVRSKGGRSGKAGKSRRNKTRKENTSRPVPALYDLVTDHAETDNIAETNPALVHELEALLLGERITEPAGFANTYHRWTGTNGADAADANNWSDYVYANAGDTYMADAGAPRASWTAHMQNTANKANSARANSNIEFLGLEIRGNIESDAAQELVVAAGARLTCRNELRVAGQGILTLEDGTFSSLRWVDVVKGGTVRGQGSVEASFYNAGSTEVTGAFNISGHYHEQPGSTLHFAALRADGTRLLVDRDVQLAGALGVSVARGFKPVSGDKITILTAGNIKGTFANAGNLVNANGTCFNISYSDKAVTLIVQ